MANSETNKINTKILQKKLYIKAKMDNFKKKKMDSVITKKGIKMSQMKL